MQTVEFLGPSRRLRHRLCVRGDGAPCRYASICLVLRGLAVDVQVCCRPPGGPECGPLATCQGEELQQEVSEEVSLLRVQLQLLLLILRLFILLLSVTQKASLSF